MWLWKLWHGERILIRVVYLCTAFIFSPRTPQLETCLSSLHNPAGLLSQSLMYGGWWCNKMVAIAGGWQGIPKWALILMSFMLIMCFYSSSLSCWGRGGSLCMPSRLSSGVSLLVLLLQKPRSNILAFMARLYAIHCQENRYEMNWEKNS